MKQLLNTKNRLCAIICFVLALSVFLTGIFTGFGTSEVWVYADEYDAENPEEPEEPACSHIWSPFPLSPLNFE